MKTKLSILIALLSVYFLQAETFKSFEAFQKHVNAESKRVRNKTVHERIRNQKISRDYEIGETRSFWRYDLSIMPPGWQNQQATCRAVGEHCYLFVADEDWNINMNQNDVDEVMNYLEDTTMNGDDFGAIQMDIELFGELPDELDNDEKLIVYYSALGSFNGTQFDGYFSSYNQVTQAEAATMNPPGYSNECEMIYMTCNPLNPTDPVRISVLSHELQHLIHWGKDSNEETWVDEGMAELAMVRFGMPDPISSFNSNANYSLNMWDQSWKDYVKVLLFFTYLDEQIEEDHFISSLVADPANSIDGIRNQLENIESNLTFEEIFHNWTIANYLDEPEIESGEFGYNAFEVPTFGYHGLYSSYPQDHNSTIEPWAVKYFVLHHDNALSFTFFSELSTPLSILSIGENVSSQVQTLEIQDGLLEIPTLEENYDKHVLVIPNASNVEMPIEFNINEETAAGNIIATNTLLNLKCYPNPISKKGRSSTIFRFELDKDEITSTKVVIYNIKGQKIKTIKYHFVEGKNEIKWNHKTTANETVANGVYFCKIKTNKHYETIKFTIIK